MDTNQLIQELAERPAPVRRLPSPWRRAAIWFVVSAIYAAVVIFFLPFTFDVWQGADARYFIEQIAAIATAGTAAVAAFWSIVPGYDRRRLLVPLAPLAVWLASLGESCAQEWMKYGNAALAVYTDWDCLTGAALIGIVPAIAMVGMLRRGAPMVPNATLALAAVAVAALANFAMRLHHDGDANMIILFWHFGSVVFLAFVASLIGRHVLKWRGVEAA